jgi:gamma-glutamylcyclotransferase (GGCT)/AIG2-like uncharacterized protein YtfP
MVEIYEIDKTKLYELDGIEGTPVHYIREKVDCILNRNRVQCFMYFVNEENLFEKSTTDYYKKI